MAFEVKLSGAEVTAYLDEVFPQWREGGVGFAIDTISPV